VFKGLASQRLLALFLAGWLLLNFPLLSLWDRDLTVLGVPLFPAALFGMWLLLIGVLAWLMERSERSERPERSPPPGAGAQDD
jgi:hypothetical protein